MADKLGKGVYEVTADADGFKAGMADAKQAHDQFVASAAKNAEKAAAAVKKTGKAAGDAVKEPAKQAEGQVDKLDAAAKRLATTIRRLGDQAGIPRSQYLENRARASGILGLEGVSESIEKIRQSEQVITKVGMSAKQTAQAMRLLPAQITDIVVGLVSGQPAYMVAIQQGGQLKDSFGGIIPAARALLSVFTPMRLALGGVAAAASAAAYGYYAGAKEADTFQRSIAATGGAAGVTAGQLMLIARSMDAISGTQGRAVETLSALAGTGSVDPANLERFALSAQKAQDVLGISIKDTVAAYSALAADPLKATEKLNEQYRYLTLSVYDQIAALEAQGRTTEAAKLAQEEFNRAQERMSADGVRYVNGLERAFNSLKSLIAETADEFKNFGRGATPEERLADIQGRLAQLRRRNDMGVGGPIDAIFDPIRIRNLEKAERDLQGQVSADAANAANRKADIQAQEAAIAARKANSDLLKKTLTDQQKLNNALKEYLDNNEKLRAVGEVITKDQERRDMAAIRASFAKKGGGGGRAYTDDAATRMLQQARETEATLMAQLDAEERLGAAARARIEFEQQIADLKEKRVLTADQKSLLANQQAILTQLERNEAIEKELSLKDLIKKKQEEINRAEGKFRERAAQVRESIGASRDARGEQYDRQLGAMGLSAGERERVAAQGAIYREFQRFQAQLTRSTPEHMLGSDEYKAEVAFIRSALSESLADHTRYYEQMRLMNADWTVGMRQGLSTYIEDAQNVAQHSERIWSGAFKGLEDSLTQFVRTGKLSFTDLADFILTEVTRMIIRMQVIAPMAKAAQGGAADGWFGQVLGSLFSTSTPITSGAPGTFAAALNAPGMFAAGGVFGRSGVAPFASGDIVSRPTLFSYGGGRSGVMGEAGYEAIMPVARTASGELGVKVTGQQKPQAVTVVMNISTPDAASFRRSEGQIKSRMASVVGTGRRFA